MALLQLVQNATTRLFGQGFSNRIFGSRTIVQKNTGIQPVIFGGPAVYPDVNLLRFIQNGYSANGTVFTIVSMCARKFGSIPRYAYQIKDPKSARQYKALLKMGAFKLYQVNELEKKAYDETIVDNDFAELLARPNEAMGQDFFYALACVFYMICGEAFIWINRGDIDELPDEVADMIKPVEMYTIPPQYVEIIPDPEDVWGVIGYYFVINGQRVFLRKSDVIHWRQPNPNFDAITRTHLRGFAPLNAGNKLVSQDESSTDAAVAMQQNQGAKGILYNESMDNLDEVQKSQVRTVVDRKINNASVKGSVASLQGKWGYLDLGQTGVDMELMESQEKTFVRLCNLFGINPMIFLTNTTYENIQQARKDLITSLLLPMACSLRDEMNRVLLPAFGLDKKQYTHDVDISQLPELQNDMSMLITSLATAWWMTPNQKLKVQNEDPGDDPDMDKVWMPNNLVMMEDAGQTDLLNSFTDVNGGNKKPGGNGNSRVPGAKPQAGN